MSRTARSPTVVFDTNVFVAELGFPDEPPVCVALAEAGAVELAVSPPLVREFSAVLDYDRLRLPAERHAEVVERVVESARVVEPAVSVDATEDPNDDAVIECALSAGAERVVSDDAHLTALDGIGGVEVLTRDAFLDRYADRDE
ncbi:putative toxin-antitoxin system toxin component, PIN family [Halorussus lipolyticus]|uniref:putative toxin-antitoxin system toxin component, PIN family n=1 Tax=Halorussus lipolyticus TaxID=3034024 RepID=UPI0023E784FE|nr:putative toxin-antitoxin system toxin component, PIN family [Halorussus sp. DT80]